MRLPSLALLCAGLACHWSATPALAQPLLTAFERFHADQPSVDGGRLLYNELGCGNCHGGDTGLPKRTGPELTSAATRANAEWLRLFLAEPSHAREGSAMPAILPADSPDAADAIVHYLTSLAPGQTKPKRPKHVNAERGKVLFHSIGCVACHQPRSDFQPEDPIPDLKAFTYPSNAFPELARKYTLSTLSEFLRDPLKSRPDGRMPRLPLEEDDSIDIAAYLLEFNSSDGTNAAIIDAVKVDKILATKGQSLVEKLQCGACHNLPKQAQAKTLTLLKSAGGCMDPEDALKRQLPRYALSQKQRTALSSYLQNRDPQASPSKLADLSLEALNCTACHQRGERGGPDLARKAYFQGDHNLGDTGRYPPPLTDVGRKLQPEWLAKIFEGTNRVRPYLKTKMPVYGASTQSLATVLTTADKKSDTGMELSGGDDLAGSKLLGTLGGLGCITCHRWGERPALGIQGPDISQIGQRLQPGWFKEYLIDPAAHRPGTLMPAFWPGGKASNHTILSGDTDRQIASIYSFAKSANGEPEGFPEITAGEFQLTPKDEPIVQRTFMEGIGTHAILVGFPAGVHLAVNGETGEPAIAWRGKFFDAYNTWFSRFTPFEKPLGESIVKWPASNSSQKRQFKGYRFVSGRLPVFLSEVDGVPLEDRFEATDSGLTRILVWDASRLKSVEIAHPDGVTVSENPSDTPGRRSFNYLWK